MDDKLPYVHLLDCSVDLADIALMNEALDVKAENQRRFEESIKNRDG